MRYNLSIYPKQKEGIIMENNQNSVIIFQGDNGTTKVSVRFSAEDIWLTQAQIAELYESSKSNISERIKHILSNGET